MADALKNFAYSAVAVAPSPATSGTSLEVTAGHGTRFPTPPFSAPVWPSGAQPLPTNAEIVRVTAIAGDVLTFTRQAEGSASRSILVGDQIAATLTAQFIGAGLMNREPSYDVSVPPGHGLIASDDYRIGASVDVRVDDAADLRVL